jgi:uncharacterized membrane protein
VFETLFTFLFKYPTLIFEQGRFALGASGSMRTVALVAAGAGLYALWTYRQLGALSGRKRAALLVVRAAMLIVAVFALLRPMLLLKVAVPQQNFVGVLVDDSRSMQIADEQGKPRGDFVRDQVGRVDGPLLTELGKRFQIKMIRFSTSAERLQSSQDMRFEGTGTRLGEAFDRARDELSGLPVAGLVMLTDGADTTEGTLDQAIGGLKSQGMPVFAVGVGRDRLTRDVQLSRAEIPRRVLKGTSLVVDVVVTQVGYPGAKVALVVEDAGRVVSTQDVTLPDDGESATYHVRFKASEEGPRVFRVKIAGQVNEEVTQNNSRDSLIEVYNRRESLLYLEGEPRFEPKFLRRATDIDDNLRVALLQRTAMATSEMPEKYLRMGLENQDELRNGFPTTREELFNYRGIILGTVEASAFTPDQQRMIEDFVDVRGGGLLALGGDLSFTEGGWGGTPLSNALPVTLDRGVRKAVYPPVMMAVRPTPAGANHPATQITDKADDATAKWRDLPQLSSVNTLGAVKPGGTVLLTGLDEKGGERPVLVYQRYGRGKTLALPVQDLWMWKMHSTVAVEDVTHQNFVQRLVRWVVDGVPDRVMVSAAPERVQKGEPITLSAEVLDPEYKGINDGQITAQISTPSGKIESVPMDWTVERDGEYAARFTPTEDGVHKVSVGGSRSGKDVGRGGAFLRVAPSDAEYFDAAMRAPLLERIAEETEGRFFRAADTSKLVEAITYSGKGVTVVEEKELWDMPVILILLLAFMGAEWVYRRKYGLA